MFSLDRWQEIFTTLRMHKLRTLLTCLSVAWGIFMLVLLVGAGQGLQNGVRGDFQDDAVNSLWIFGGTASMPYKGMTPGRRTVLRNEDTEYLRHNQQGVEEIAARFSVGDPTVSYGAQTSTFDIRATHPGHQFIENTIMVAGRFLNDLDIMEHRKVAVIGVDVASFLFGDIDPIGRYVTIGDQPHRVVGIFKDEGEDNEQQKIYIPISTAQLSHGSSDNVWVIMFTVDEATTVAESKAIEEEIRQTMAGRHGFDPTDRQALRVRNLVERFSRITSVLSMIEIFVWFISAGTIIAGVVGVSNIMLISVKERTVEFGIRKAIGAQPSSIITTVLQESIFVTAIAGYAGLVAGVGALALMGALVPANDYFSNPSVDLGLAIKATLLLIASGALAGYFPARRAAKIRPIEALRNE